MEIRQNNQAERVKRPAALLLDMDGTITEPMLDFPLIKAEMGIGDRPILEALAELNGAEREAAEEVLLRHEAQAAAESKLNPGCAELLDWAREHGVRTALITRNSLLSAEIVVRRHGLRFDAIITRELGMFKPRPEPLREARHRLNVGRCECWMVGDGEHDVVAGEAAGIRTVWISHGKQREFAKRAWRVVKDLWELVELLRTCRNVP